MWLNNTPMHDAYDSFWAFRDFRGQRAPTVKTAGTDPVPSSQTMCWPTQPGTATSSTSFSITTGHTDGTGYKDYAKGINYDKVNAKLKLAVTPSNKARTLTVSRGQAKVSTLLKKDVAIPPGRRNTPTRLSLAFDGDFHRHQVERVSGRYRAATRQMGDFTGAKNA